MTFGDYGLVSRREAGNGGGLKVEQKGDKNIKKRGGNVRTEV